MEGIGHRKDVGAVDSLEYVEIFVVLGFNADRNPGVRNHRVRGAVGFKVRGRVNQCLAVGDVKRVEAVLSRGQGGENTLELLFTSAHQAHGVASGGKDLGHFRADAA